MSSQGYLEETRLAILPISARLYLSLYVNRRSDFVYLAQAFEFDSSQMVAGATLQGGYYGFSAFPLALSVL